MLEEEIDAEVANDVGGDIENLQVAVVDKGVGDECCAVGIERVL